MRYYLDTEFYEKPGSIELISIGLCCDDGREYYAESKQFDWRMHDPTSPVFNGDRWLWDNVHVHLTGQTQQPAHIAQDILKFVRVTERHSKPEFWAYFADYDWVVFCWLFGRMIDLPQGFPMFCRDLKQLMWHLNIDKDLLPQQVEAEHSALYDARWVRSAVQQISDRWVIGEAKRLPAVVRDVLTV